MTGNLLSFDCLDPFTKCIQKQTDMYAKHHLHPKPYRTYRPTLEAAEQEREGPKRPAKYFCDWYPKLFGIDEEEIPLSEDEEGIFDIDWDTIEEQAQELTEEDLEKLRVGPYITMTDDELKEEWLRQQHPIYGRRARQKPIFKNDKEEVFDCICEVDYNYDRHYVPNFGGKPAKDGVELKVPHFKAFWEDLKEHGEFGDMERISQIFKPEEQEEMDMETSQRPVRKFKNTNKNTIRKMRDDLLATLRPLHCREVRRFRMPYSEALYLEMQEDDCRNGAEFFKHLIIKDYFVHKAPENFDLCLRDNRIVMNKIVELLRVCERFSKREEYHKEAYMYLRTGKHFNDHESTWWWLAEEFYAKAVKVSQNCVIDGGKAEAISNYIFGTFLLECVNRVQPAQEHLLRARELSMGKDWSARNILQIRQDTVHKECVTHLCRALIAACKELRKNGKPEEALPLIHRSYKLCEELGSWRSDIEMETFFELGMTYQAVGMLNWAKSAFRKFIGLAEMQDFEKGICDGYLELAICYRSEGDTEKCYRNILSYLSTARTRENVNLMAFGHRYLGEFLLNAGKSYEAAFRFNLAFNSFLAQYLECANIPFECWQPEHFTLAGDVELTRVLVGLADGELLTKAIATVILAAKEGKNQDKLLELIKWKNTGDKTILQERLKDFETALFTDPDESEAEPMSSRTVHFPADMKFPTKRHSIMPSMQVHKTKPKPQINLSFVNKT